MNWLKRIFCKQDEYDKWVDPWGLPSVSVNIPMPKVKPPKADKDISEPIISFVKCVQENPKRFKVIFDYEYCGLESYKGSITRSNTPTIYHYCLQDTKTKESWTFVKDTTYPLYLKSKSGEGKNSYNPEWITTDERYYLIESIKTIFHNRKDRKEKLDQIRKDRRIRDERNRLKEIYQ